MTLDELIPLIARLFSSKRHRYFAFGGFELAVASPEDLVLYKLRTWRTQDQADIENLLANVKGLDRRYIEEHLAPIQEETGYPVRERWEQIVRRA